MTFHKLLWKPEFDIGIEEIDLQHRYFLRLINRIGDELSTTKPDEPYFDRLLDELFKYAAFHFASEENIMMKYRYPNLDEHRNLHLSLLDQLSWRAASGTSQDLLDFLTDWFLHHTQEADRRIGQFILEQPTTPCR